MLIKIEKLNKLKMVTKINDRLKYINCIIRSHMYMLICSRK